MIAANAPNWARFFQSWSTASAGSRSRDREVPQLVAARRLEDLGQEFRQQRRGQADEQEQPADDRQAVGPPQFEQLLAQQDAEPVHAAAPSSASPSPRPRAGGTRPRGSVGRVRRRSAEARGGDERQQARGGGGLVGHRHDDRSSAPVRRRRARPRACAQVATSPATAAAWPGPGRSGTAAARSGPAGRRGAPRSPAGRGRGSRPGRRSRSMSARTWVEKMTVASAAQLGDEREEVASALRVERADRLVEDQQAGPGDDRLGDPESLAHRRRSTHRSVAAPRRRARPVSRTSAARRSSLRAREALEPPANSTSSRPVIQP